MPRLRRFSAPGPAAGVSSKSGSGPSAMLGESREDGLGSVNLFADRRFRLGVRRQVDVHARAEADEPVALAALQLGPRTHVAEDSPGDEAGDLHAGTLPAPWSLQPERVALVIERRLVERRVEEAPREVPALLDRAVDRRPVGVHVEHVHEDADLQRLALEVRIDRLADPDDASV